MILLLAIMNVSAVNINDALAEEQQQRTVSGVVTDSDGITLPGVTVIAVQDDSADAGLVGTTTDMDGNFSLNVPEGTEFLHFSFVGMQEQEVSIEGEVELNVVMEYATAQLDEMVVVGYGTQTKESVVGSIVQIREGEINRTGNVTDLTQALSGQLPGVNALTSSGEPGGVLQGESATNIFIRGQSTWNGGQPLILVDGVERSMNNIDANEVATISVLKDASATAVFGVKGANGVILITTKRGSEGKTILNFNYTSTGIRTSKLPGKLDSYAAMNAKNEMIEREGVINEPSWNDYVPYEIVQRYQLPQTDEYRNIYPNVDWEDEMFKDMGFGHKATLSARGGSRDVQYYGMVGYTNEGDMFEDYDNYKGYEPNYDFNRLNFRSNIDFRLTNTTKLQMNLSGHYSQKNTNWNNEGSTSRADAWMWAAAYRLPPNLFLPMYDDGNWGAYQEGGNPATNPIAAVYNIGIRETRSTQLNSDFAIEQELDFIAEGLSAKVNFFYDNSIRSEGGIFDQQNSIRPAEYRTNVPYTQIYPDRYEGPDQDPSEYTVILPQGDEEYDWMLRPWSIRQESIGAANFSSSIPVSRRLTYQGQINYDRSFFDVHNVTATGVFKREEFAYGNMFKNFREDWIGRTTYNYDTRYLFEFNGAYNGSEQFGPGYRFEFFPSIALGWIASNEKFFDLGPVNNLRFRYSIGKVGDDNVSGARWLYESQMGYGGNSRLNSSVWGTSPYTFYRESVVGNPDVRWETALKSNYGIELGMYLDLLTLSVDYFTEDRTDVLMSGGSRSVPSFFGATPPSANLGRVKSSGFEVELGYNQFINNDFSIWADLSVTHNQNEVLERDDPALMDGHLKSEGFQIGQEKRLMHTDIYTNWDEVYASVPTENNDGDKLPGYYDIVDFNADGVINGNEDRVPMGYSAVPQNSASISLGASYKGLDVMAQFYGTNNANRWVPLSNYASNYDVLFDHVADYWSKDNLNANSYLPRWQTSAENIGHYHLYDASYIRLRTVDVSYTFGDSDWAQQAGLSNLRVFLTANNLFFWSDLPDDRERTHSGASATQGAYPTTKRINMGIDITF
ncbi:MAG: TonB-dependent receptor [Balneolales bacterium]